MNEQQSLIDCSDMGKPNSKHCPKCNKLTHIYYIECDPYINIQGPTGPIGPSGLKGVNGDIGEIGHIGKTGDKGPKGECCDPYDENPNTTSDIFKHIEINMELLPIKKDINEISGYISFDKIYNNIPNVISSIVGDNNNLYICNTSDVTNSSFKYIITTNNKFNWSFKTINNNPSIYNISSILFDNNIGVLYYTDNSLIFSYTNNLQTNEWTDINIICNSPYYSIYHDISQQKIIIAYNLNNNIFYSIFKYDGNQLTNPARDYLILENQINTGLCCDPESYISINKINNNVVILYSYKYDIYYCTLKYGMWMWNILIKECSSNFLNLHIYQSYFNKQNLLRYENESSYFNITYYNYNNLYFYNDTDNLFTIYNIDNNVLKNIGDMPINSYCKNYIGIYTYYNNNKWNDEIFTTIDDKCMDNIELVVLNMECDKFNNVIIFYINKISNNSYELKYALRIHHNKYKNFIIGPTSNIKPTADIITTQSNTFISLFYVDNNSYLQNATLPYSIMINFLITEI